MLLITWPNEQHNRSSRDWISDHTMNNTYSKNNTRSLASLVLLLFKWICKPTVILQLSTKCCFLPWKAPEKEFWEKKSVWQFIFGVSSAILVHDASVPAYITEPAKITSESYFTLNSDGKDFVSWKLRLTLGHWDFYFFLHCDFYENKASTLKNVHYFFRQNTECCTVFFF